MKPIKTWILIADGARARIVINDGPGRGVREVEDAQFSASHLPDREIDADRPGRTFDAGGDGRHAKVPKTPSHRHREQQFAGQLADYVDNGLTQGLFDRLIVVAAPGMLGDLRAKLSNPVKQVLLAELSKDLTHLPDHELAPHLEETLNV
jgi:protein required for attachment to host cells